MSKSLEDYYSIEPPDLGDVHGVSMRKGFAPGSMLVGIILIGIATGYVVGGISGEIIGPGVV